MTMEELLEGLRSRQSALCESGKEIAEIQAIITDIESGRPFRMPRDVHNWFELSYAQYLVIPRSVLEAMPIEWQWRFVECLQQLDHTIDWMPKEGAYSVELRMIEEVWSEADNRSVEQWGEQLEDPFQNYRHPVPMPFIQASNNNQIAATAHLS